MMLRISDAHYGSFGSNPSVSFADSSPCTGELFGGRVAELARGRRRAVGRDDLIPPCWLCASENKNTCHPELVEGSGRLRYGRI